MNNIHVFTHTLPHRGPGASRARTRWQPYAASTLSASGFQRSPSSYLPTPASSVVSASPPSALIHPTCSLDSLKFTHQPSNVNALRDPQKGRYAAQLIDQAVKTLCDTWHPDDIPTVFTSARRECLCAQPDFSLIHPENPQFPPVTTTGVSLRFTARNSQLPSPLSPTTTCHSQVPSPIGDRCESYSQAPDNSGTSNLVPIKGFVHEVLRRSRTSTGVLQTALCYLEAVRPKVPELLHAEKACPASEFVTERVPMEPRIIQGLYEEQFSGTDCAPTPSDEPIETVRISDTVLVSDLDEDVPSEVPSTRGGDGTSLPLLPALPSPLCCPRRTFLACLVLASKFLQDRSYSNRAWAKLAGLPPREIGRCERALGEALEWRLWVGKIPSSATKPGPSNGRTVSRSRSDNDILCEPARTCSPTSTAAWAARPTADGCALASSSAHAFPSRSAPTPASRCRTRGLQRSATVPTFGAGRSVGYVDNMAASTYHPDRLGYYHDVGAAPGMGYDTTFAMDVEPQDEVSPSLLTPTLTYSPMSSASSSSDGSEERTIQMSMIMDLPTPSISSFGSIRNSGGPWVASYTPADPTNPYGSFGSINPYNPYVPNNAFVADSTEELAGPLLPAMHPPDVKQVLVVLPSFATTFAGSCPGVFGSFVQ